MLYVIRDGLIWEAAHFRKDRWVEFYSPKWVDSDSWNLEFAGFAMGFKSKRDLKRSLQKKWDGAVVVEAEGLQRYIPVAQP